MYNRPFFYALTHPRGPIAILGEIKLASPSAGVLGRPEDIEERARAYERAGIDAISMVTERSRFLGDPSFISRIKHVSILPILQKDFVTKAAQILESKMLGADALLLIARIIPRATLKRLVIQCQTLDVEPIVEIHDENDLAKVVATTTEIIAVNARNLETLAVDVLRACDLLTKIPDRYIKLGFSGIRTPVEITKYRNAGAKGVLIGTALMQTTDIQRFVEGVQAL